MRSRISSAPSLVTQTRWVPPDLSGSIELMETQLSAHLAWTSASGRAKLTARLNDRACRVRSEEHTSELQSRMRLSYAVFCLTKKNYEWHQTTKHGIKHVRTTIRPNPPNSRTP